MAGQPDIATNSKNAAAASTLLLNAVALHQSGHLDQAAAIYQQILLSSPNDSNALHYLGLVAFQKKNYAESVALIERAIKINGNTPAFYCNLGNAHMRLTQHAAALDAYQEAFRLDPRFAVALIGVANACLADGKGAPALAAARRAVLLAPQLFDAWSVLGDVVLDAESIDEAEQCYRHALSLRPASSPALVKLANILTRFGRLDEAEQCLAQALRHDPLCEPAVWARLMNLNYASSDQKQIHAAHADWARRFVAHDTATPQRPAGPNATGRRLRIGYLSSDFRRHALRFFIRPILRHHDRSQFEVYCYHNHAGADDVTEEIKALSEHWVDCHALLDAELAARIVADEIDVLIDLSGHSQGNRLKALGLKPAPVQATMLGYLNSTGLKAMDYRIVDGHTCPPGQFDEDQGEALARLPDCQWCYEPDADANSGTPPTALPALANGHVTFGCFHNLAKVTPSQIALFVAILRGLPEARLLMVVWGKSPREQLLHLFSAAGLGERVRIIEPLGHHDYLALYEQVDIGLDTFPYAGGTTSLESLWMGVPFVTMKGATQASNGGVSILSNLGLQEFIADDGQAYVAIAQHMAGDVERLGQLRQSLRALLMQSPIMQGAHYVQALEALYRGFMARAWADSAAGVSAPVHEN